MVNMQGNINKLSTYQNVIFNPSSYNIFDNKYNV